MANIELSERDVVPLKDIAPHVLGLRLLVVNVFAVTLSSGDWILVDAGLPLSAARIRHWAEQHFGGKRPLAVLLTHGHFDHVGALKDLSREWDVLAYANSLELPYITGRAEYPPPDPSVGRGLLALMSPLYPRGPVDIGARATALPENGTVPHLPDWRWVPTPGHTDGHVSYYRETDGMLLVGDAFCTTQAESMSAIATQKPELHGPPAYYTSDWDKARTSVELLAALKPRVVAPGHGQAMAGPEMTAALQLLADRFDELARPKRGKYATGQH